MDKTTKASNTKHVLPPPIARAQEALVILKQEGLTSDELEKRLPAFAINLSRSGGEVTLEALLTAAREGNLDLKLAPRQRSLRYEEVIAHLPPPPRKGFIPAKDIFEAAQHGDLRSVKKFLSNGIDLNEKSKDQRITALQYAAAHGHKNVVQFLLRQKGIDRCSVIQPPLAMLAMNSGDVETARFLIKAGYPATDLLKTGLSVRILERENLDLAYLYAENNTSRPLSAHHVLNTGNMEFFKYLHDRKLLFSLGPGQKTTLKLYNKLLDINKKNWMRTVHVEPPSGVEEEDPRFYKRKAFETTRSILEKENCDWWKLNKLAFVAAGLFGTEERVLQYLDKWGVANKKPLTSLLEGLKLPEEVPTDEPLAMWADAVLKCGPSMAQLFRFAGEVPCPEKSNDGHTWSMAKTRIKAAPFAYEKGQENPELAALFFENRLPDSVFQKGLHVLQKQKKDHVKRLPQITINGETFGLKGAVFKLLDTNDLRGLILGELTDCCQSVGQNRSGNDCAVHGFTSEEGGFYVVEKDGKILGQTWAWRGKNNELVFDSLETLGNRVTAEQWKKLSKAFADALAKTDTDVTSFNIGLSSGTPGIISSVFNHAATPAIPVDYRGYRDSAEQIIVWEKKSSPRKTSPRR